MHKRLYCNVTAKLLLYAFFCTLLSLTVSFNLCAQNNDSIAQQLTDAWDSVKDTYQHNGLDNEDVVMTLDLIYTTVVSKMAGVMAQIVPAEEDIIEGHQLLLAYEYFLNDLIKGGEEKFLKANKLLNELLLEHYQSLPKDDYLDGYYDSCQTSSLFFAKTDLLSKRAYYRACLSIYESDINAFEDNWSLLIGSMKYLKNAYSDTNELYHCYICAVNELAMMLHRVGQSNYAMILLYSILNQETNDPFDESSCDIITKEFQELARTNLCYISVDIGESDQLFYIVKETFGKTYFNINNILQQRSCFLQCFPDITSNDSREVIKETELLLANGINGERGFGIWRSACYASLSHVYRSNFDFGNAKRYITESLSIDANHFSLDHQMEYTSVLYASGDYEAAKNNCLKCIDYINSKRVNSFTKYLDDIYLLLCMIGIRQKDYADIVDYASSYCFELQNTFIYETRYLTPDQLNGYWTNTTNGDIGLSFLAQIAEAKHEGAGPLYDALLFHKNLVIRMCDIFRENINNSGDQELIDKYKYYLEWVRTGNRNDDEILIEKELALLYSKHSEFKKDYCLSWKDVQNKLNKKDVAIEFVNYYDGADNPKLYYAAVIIKPGYIVPHFIKLCTSDELNELWGRAEYGTYPKYYEDARLDQVSLLIWGKLDQELEGEKNIYYSTYQLLSQMNLDLLLHKTGGKRMNERYNMFRLSSTGQLCRSNKHISNQTITIVGAAKYGITSSRPIGGEEMRGLTRGKGWDDLPGAQEEIVSITYLTPSKWQPNVFTGREATEDSIIELSGHSPEILHIATHGFYMSEKSAKTWPFYKEYGNAKIPENQRVGLVFASANNAWLYLGLSGANDGTLTASEILGLDLSNTRILTLSACQSGIGEWYMDGSYGLQRAFKIAGCETMIMSLWPVPDEATRIFMSEFYRLLFKGVERNKAFKEAQLKVKKEYSSPMFWGAFILLD